MVPLPRSTVFATAMIAMVLAGMADADQISGNSFFGRERPVTERGCIPGPHDPMRVRRLPGRSRSSSKPHDPLEETFVHCSSHDGGKSLEGT